MFNMNKLTNEDIAYIELMAKKEFKTEEDVPEKIQNLCIKLEVSSFEEILNKTQFLKVTKINLNKDYYNHVQTYANTRSHYTILLRQLLLYYGINAPEEFCDFCFSIYALKDRNATEEIEAYLASFQKNEELQKLLKKMDIIIDLFQYRFDSIFNAIFQTEDEKTYILADEIEQILNSPASKYLFIIRNILDDIEGFRVNRKLTLKEKNMVQYLVYEDNEIAYMEENGISYSKFRKILREILEVYNIDTIRELLIYYYVIAKSAY